MKNFLHILESLLFLLGKFSNRDARPVGNYIADLLLTDNEFFRRVGGFPCRLFLGERLGEFTLVVTEFCRFFKILFLYSGVLVRRNLF